MWRAVLARVGSDPRTEGDRHGDGSPLTGTDHRVVEVAGVLVVDVTAPTSLALALDDDDSPVLVVAHERHAHAAATAVSVLAGHRPEVPVARLAHRHAPVAALAALVTALDLTANAGRAVQVVDDLLAEAWSAVVLPSVARLSDPNPSVLQHLRSWLPGGRFLVRLGDDREVVRLEETLVLADVDRGEHRAVVDLDGSDDEVARRLVQQTAPTEVLPLALPGGWGGLYGREPELQLALLPTDLAGRDGVACRGCSLEAGTAVCPFCRTTDPARGGPEPFAPLLATAPRRTAP